MTNERGYQRISLRAPLRRTFLYEDDGFVYKVKSVNISEGGVLLEQFAHVPEINLVPLMMDIPIYPDLQKIDIAKIKVFSHEQLERKIIRARAKMVRTEEKESAVEQVFVKRFGCEFVNPSSEVTQTIANYVETFARNIVYVLNLFDAVTNAQNIELIRGAALVLGYDSDAHLTILKQQMLHDYQSLENL